MKKTLVLIAFAMASVMVFAAPAPYPVTVNSRALTAPPLIAYRGNECVYRVYFTDGDTPSSISNATPFLAWSTNNNAAVNVTSSYSVVNVASGIVDFTFSPSSLNYTPGRYVYEVGVYNGNARVYRQGIFTIVGSPVGQGAGSVTWSTNVSWAAVNWIGAPTITIGDQSGSIKTSLVFSASAFGTWLSTNTYVKTELDQTALAALAAFSSTNKTKVVHSSVSSNVWATLGVGGTVTVHTVVAAQVPDPDNIVVDDPHDIFDGTYQNQGGGVYWFNSEAEYIAITATAATLYTSGDTAAYGGDGTVPPFEFQEALNGFPLPVPTTSFALKAGYVTNSVPYVLTTGNVWQAVIEAKADAAASQFAADQAATLVNYHASIDPAPHPGKFVGMTNGTATNLTIIGGNVYGDTLIGAQAITNAIQSDLAKYTTFAQVSGIVYSNSVSSLIIYTNATGTATSWWSVASGVTNSGLFFSGTPGVITNNQLVANVGSLNVIPATGKGIITIDSDGGGNGYSLTLTENRVYTGGGYNDGTHGLQLQPFGGNVGIGSLFAREALDVTGNAMISGSNTAAVVVSQGPVLLGPTINGKQAHLFSNGTNLFFVNVNFVTNALTTN